MGTFQSIGGMITVEIISADAVGILTKINQINVVLSNVVSIDELTICADVARKDYKKIHALVKDRNDQIKITQKKGIYWTVKGLLRRPVLLVGILIPILLSAVLPRYILFFEVEGNAEVSKQRIIEEAAKCGIDFGTLRRSLRSEQMKNALLESIPQLQWAGINTYGCRAVISVREKTAAEDETLDHSVCSIVAARDGVIRECTVQQGNSVCRVGQAVKSGQVLVSGYTDCGFMIKATHAKAEIYADTIRELLAVSPGAVSQRGEITGSKTKYSFVFGKNMINLYKDSGIWDTSCVKIYEQKNMTLPGGFQLPIGIIQETWVIYNTELAEPPVQDDLYWMETAARDYLFSQMIAGQIIEKTQSLQIMDGRCVLNGQYACVEMIGQVKNEEIITKDAENG